MDDQGLSAADRTLLKTVLGEWWSMFFHYAGPERDRQLKALLDAARSEGRSPPPGDVREEVARIMRNLTNEVHGWAPDSDRAISARKRATDAAILALSASPIQGGGWRPIETGPKGAENEAPICVLLAWYNVGASGARTYHVGEGYWCATDGAWWWAGTAPSDYATDCIEQSITGHLVAWQPLPAPPVPSEETK